MNNRIIKFRIWNNKTKQWIHGPHERNDLDGVNLFGENILFGNLLDGVSIEDLNEIAALQFTGLKDKNGKEIFEGDIVKWVVEPLGLRYKEEFEEWEKQGKPMQEIVREVKYRGAYLNPFTETAFGPFKNETCEIIGNIFKNPELLNK